MKKFEYDDDLICGLVSSHAIVFNTRGNNGWELVSVLLENNNVTRLYWKRELEQTNPSIDEKIRALRELTSNFVFIEYYTHTKSDMYKILNEYTDYKQDKHVLCKVSEGIEKALDLAIKKIGEAKIEYNERDNDPS